MNGKTIQPLERGDPVKRNWRTINEINAQLSHFRVGISNNRDAIAQMRRRPRDLGTGAVSTFRVVSVESDHYVCHTWDETTLAEGDEEILVARPWEHRNSILSERIDGVIHNYSYTSTTQRSSNNGSTVETQYITPPILLTAGDQPNPTVISAVTANTGVSVGAVSVTLLDHNTGGRAWATPDE